MLLCFLPSCARRGGARGPRTSESALRPLGFVASHCAWRARLTNSVGSLTTAEARSRLPCEPPVRSETRTPGRCAGCPATEGGGQPCPRLRHDRVRTPLDPKACTPTLETRGWPSGSLRRVCLVHASSSSSGEPERTRGRGQPARISVVSLLLVRCPTSRGGREGIWRCPAPRSTIAPDE